MVAVVVSAVRWSSVQPGCAGRQQSRPTPGEEASIETHRRRQQLHRRCKQHMKNGLKNRAGGKPTRSSRSRHPKPQPPPPVAQPSQRSAGAPHSPAHSDDGNSEVLPIEWRTSAMPPEVAEIRRRSELAFASAERVRRSFLGEHQQQRRSRSRGGSGLGRRRNRSRKLTCLPNRNNRSNSKC